MYYVAVVTAGTYPAFCGHLHRSEEAAQKCADLLGRKTTLLWWVCPSY